MPLGPLPGEQHLVVAAIAHQPACEGEYRCPDGVSVRWDGEDDSVLNKKSISRARGSFPSATPYRVPPRRCSRRGCRSSRPLLDVALLVIPLEHVRQAREREVAGREMDGDEPGAGDVDEVLELVGERDAVDGGIHGEEEEEDVRDVAEPG